MGKDDDAFERTVLFTPLLYRLRVPDLLLPGLLPAALVLFFLHGRLGFGEEAARGLLYGSFLILMLCLNRAAWLLSGRGRIVRARLKQAIRRLAAGKGMDILPFCLQADIPFSEYRAAVDELMAEHLYLGYLDHEALRLVISEQRLDEKNCPVCGKAVPAREDGDGDAGVRVCGHCRSVLYLA